MKLAGLLLIVASTLYTSAWAQSPPAKETAFDSAEFTRKFKIVEWLVEYDEVAWKTSDAVMTEPKDQLAKLGPEWFAFQDVKGQWHALYGKLEDKKYQQVFHYLFDGGKATRSSERIDQKLADLYAMSLSTARGRVTSLISPDSPRFNQYIRREADGTFNVWLLPAFQTDGTAVYGGEAYFHVDRDGLKILKQETYFQPKFRGFRSSPPREIWLDYTDIAAPSLGSIFFVWYYKGLFTNIFIDNAKSTSTVIKSGSGYMWVHVEKDKKASK